MNRRLASALAAAAALALAYPSAAAAHGNPLAEALSSDVIALPTTAEQPRAETVDGLRTVVDAARKGGTRMRVAIVASPADLAESANLYGYPEETATYLGRDLGTHNLTVAGGAPEPVLVVMPGGMGSMGLSPEASRAVRQIEMPPDPSADDLVSAGGYGVQEIMRADGRPIDERFGAPDSGTGGILVPVLIVLALLALVGVLIVIRVRGARPAGAAGTS